MKGSWSAQYVRIYILILALLATGCSSRRTPIISPAPEATESPRADETLVVTTATPTDNRPFVLPVRTSTISPDEVEAHNTVASALNKIKQAGPVRIHSVTTTEDGKSTAIVAEAILPERYHILTPTSEVMVIGNQTYARQKDRWVKTNLDVSGLMGELFGNLSDQAVLGITDAFLAHAETIGGIPTSEYRYHTSIDLAGEAVPSDSQIWIAETSGLPVRLESTGNFAGVHSTTVQEITYDPSIKIELPTP